MFITPNEYVVEVETNTFVKEIIVRSFPVASLVESRSRETQPVCEPPPEI